MTDDDAFTASAGAHATEPPHSLDSAATRVGARVLAVNTAWIISERVLVMASGLIINVWFVRYLGPSAYGQYAYALSFTALFAAVANLGLDQIVVRELARGVVPVHPLVGTATLLRFGAGTIAMAIAIAVVPLGRNEPGIRLLVGIAAANCAAQALITPELWFQSQVAARAAALTKVSVALASQGVRAVLMMCGAAVSMFVGVYVATTATTGALLFHAWSRRGGEIGRLRFEPKIAASLLADGWPLVITGMAVTVYMKIDQVMIGTMIGGSANGVYAAAVMLSEVWYVVPVAMATSVFPMLVRARDGMSSEDYRERMQLFFDVMAAAAYVIALLTTVFADLIVTQLYGTGYTDAAGLLRIHTWAIVFVAIGTARTRYLMAENMTRFAMIATIAGAVINVALNAAFIPRFGAAGSAWATLASQCVAAYLSGTFTRRTWWVTRQMTLALLVPLRPRVLVTFARRALRDPARMAGAT